MAWLGTLLGEIIWFLVQKAEAQFEDFFKKKRAQQAVIAAAAQTVKPLQDAKTGQQVKDATQSALDGT